MVISLLTWGGSILSTLGVITTVLYGFNSIILDRVRRVYRKCPYCGKKTYRKFPMCYNCGTNIDASEVKDTEWKWHILLANFTKFSYTTKFQAFLP